MWSRITRKYFVWSLKSASWFHTCPFNWNSERDCVELKSPWGIALWKCQFLLELCFELFVIFRLLEMHVKDLGTARDKITMKYTTVAYALPCFYQFATWKRLYQYPTFINSVMRMVSSFQEGRTDLYSKEGEEDEGDATGPLMGSQKAEIRNGSDRYMKYCFFLGRTIVAVQTLSIFLRPHRRFLLTSLWPNPEKVSFLIRLPLGLFHAYLIWCLAFKVHLNTFSTLAYVSPAVLMLQKLKKDSKIRSWKAQRHFHRCYSQLTVVHNMFNIYFASIEFPGTKGILLSVAILSTYSSIRIEGLRRLILTLVALATTVTLEVIYQTVADVRAESTEVIRAWRFCGRDKLFRLRIRAIRPLKTRIGSLYTVSRAVVLAIMFIILDRTITLLLTF